MILDNPFVSDARVEKEALSLIDFGAEVTVACTKDEKLPNSDNRNGIHIIRCISDFFNSPFKKEYKEFLDKTVREILEINFDILHCHDFHMLSIGVEIKKRKKSIILIYDAHEYLRGWPFYETSDGWLNKLKGRIVWNFLLREEKKNVQRADHVITITDGIANQLQKIYGLNSKPIVLGNFAKKHEPIINKSYFHELYNLAPNTQIIIHTGTIYHTDQQIKDLYDIILSLENIALVFIGNRPRFYSEKQKVISNNSYNRRIFFHEYLSNQKDNIQLIASGDIGLMHIRDKWEAHKIGFSNRFVEYLSAQLPVIATPQEFTMKINLEFNCCEFYSENDIENLKKAIIKISMQLSKYTENAIIAQNNMNWEHESLKLLKLYSTLND